MVEKMVEKQQTLQQLLVEGALEHVLPGTHLAAALVDADGRARIELLIKLPDGWRNETLRMPTTGRLMSLVYDDFVVASVPR